MEEKNAPLCRLIVSIWCLQVSAIKYGKLDACYDASCNTAEHEYAHQSSDPSIDIAHIGQSVKENTVLHANKDVKEPGHGMSLPRLQA